MQAQNTRDKFIAGSIAGIVALALVAAIIVYELNKSSHASLASTVAMRPTQGTTQTNTSAVTSSGSMMASGYKDGTYSASSDYYVPGGQESIQVTLALKNGVVTDVSIGNSESNGVSAQYQQAFMTEYKSQVVGKSIDSVSLSYVAGASDTTQGFDDALNQIASQAKA